MDTQRNRTQQVTAIVAAYNEGPRISRVLQVLGQCRMITEVIVVDDGSQDKTADIAETFPVQVIRLEKNQGKAAAMNQGIQQAAHDIIFFCDADVRGLTCEVIEQTIAPIQNGTTDMMIAMRNRKIYYLRFIFAFIPLLGGERALHKQLWLRVPDRYKQRFMIETALNFYARYFGKGFQYKVFPKLTQTVKEKKYGVWVGLKARIQMFAEIIQAGVLLQLHNVPPTLRSGRAALANITAGVIGSACGVALLAASYTGPVQFIRDVFAQELLEDPNAPFVHLLLNLAANISIDALVALAVGIIGTNLIVILLGLRNVPYLLIYQPSSVDRIE